VAAVGAARVVWDGERLIRRPQVGPRPAVRLEPELGGAVERVVRAWAVARGCDVVTQPLERVVLTVTRTPAGRGAGGLEGMRCGRDGWSWEPELLGVSRPPGQAWLATAEGGEPVVAWQPGQVTLAAGRYESDPSGDPADFALSWAGLLDRAALPPAGVVPVEERADAGAGVSRGGEPPAAPAGQRPNRPAAWLAATAALLALAGLGAGRR
jgi:hypothetical protein